LPYQKESPVDHLPPADTRQTLKEIRQAKDSAPSHSSSLGLRQPLALAAVVTGRTTVCRSRARRAASCRSASKLCATSMNQKARAIMQWRSHRVMEPSCLDVLPSLPTGSAVLEASCDLEQ